jgi:alpha-ketoglutarate-dependent taurine dioxygenase
MINPPTAATNEARHYQHINVLPLTGALGAEVLGIDIRQLSNAQLEEIKQAMADHLVLFFRDQQLSIEDQEKFTRALGDFGKDPYVKGIEGHPHVLRLVKEADEKTPYVFGGAWHSDWSFQETPPAYTILYGKDIPAFGGDTLFVNLYQAYNNLSAPMKTFCEGLNAVHSAQRGYGPAMKSLHQLYEHMEVVASEDAMNTQLHPMVRTHPITENKSLYISETYTVGIAGMHQDEADCLLNFLNRQAVDPINTCRFRWQPGSVAMWDNRCTLHLPLGDYLGSRREMMRATVAGEKPYLQK